MGFYRFLLRVAQALGVASGLAGVAGLVYWHGASNASVLMTAGSGLLLASGAAALLSSLILESAEAEVARLRGERDILAGECDSSRTRVRRLERRQESLSVVREIHRSTNIITRSERLRQILTVIGQLAENVEASLFALRERVPGEADPAALLRPVAYHASRDLDELFIRFDRGFPPSAAICIADAVAATNGSRRALSGDLVACGEPVGRIEAVMFSSDGFGVAAEAAPEDVLAWVLAGTDLDCTRAAAALEGGKVIRTRDASSADQERPGPPGIEFLYPLSAEGEMVGALRLRIPQRELGGAGSGVVAGGPAELDELDEVLAECARHVALALKKEADADRAITDGLTGLLLKREFEPRLAEELAASAAERRPVALLVVDIDHFKKVNDTHGHRTGDMILRGVAGLVRRHIRARDSAYRYGGEEICLVLPGTGAREAKQIAERLRQSVEEARFTSEVGPEVGVTISIGLAAADPRRSPSGTQGRQSRSVDSGELFHRADTAVYRAKRRGRNRIVVWTSRMKMRPAKSSAARPSSPKSASSGRSHGVAGRPGEAGSDAERGARTVKKSTKRRKKTAASSVKRSGKTRRKSSKSTATVLGRSITRMRKSA